MKYIKDILSVLLILGILGVGIYLLLRPPPVAETETEIIYETFYDTIRVTETIPADTVHVTIRDTIYYKDTVIIETEKDTVATASKTIAFSNDFQPRVSLEYSYRKREFSIGFEGEVPVYHQYETRIQTRKAKLFRPAVLLGYTEERFSVGLGLSIQERLAVYLTVNSDGQAGICLSYWF